MRKLFLCFFLISCGAFEKVEPQDPAPDSRVSSLEGVVQRWTEELYLLAEPNGWVFNDCDAMLWQGKLQAAALNFGAEPEAAEFKEEPGRFGRRPPPRCWTPEGGDQGSKTTWSRDMGLALIYWSWRSGNLGALQRHESYGRASKWLMGEPLDDGRTLYTPAMIGTLYQAIFGLGGAENDNRRWPGVYSSGLTDFQAHLQVMSIALRGEISWKLGQTDDVPSAESDSGLVTSISGTMFDRLEEHFEREPNNPYFAAVWGKYSGDMGPALDLCLNAEERVGEYVRCHEFRRCQLAELIHSCDFVRRVFEKDWP